MGTWNWLDWILAAIAVASIVAAMMKGFVRELISLAAVIVGLVVAALEYWRAAAWFEDLTKSHDIALGLGFLSLFLATLVVGAIVSHFAQKMVKAAGVEWFDRFLGGVFGLCRAILVDCVLLLAMVTFAIKPEAVHQSSLAPYVIAGTRVLALAMPGGLRVQFQQRFEKFRQEVIQSDKKAM